MKLDKQLLAFNRGVVSELGLARIDVERLSMSAEVQKNYMPRVLGSMMLRPGMEYQNETLDNKKAKHLRFIFDVNDTAMVEMTDMAMRVKVDDQVVTRPSVAPATDFGSGNPYFTSNITGWDTSDTEVGATTPAHATIDGNGYMALLGDGSNASIAKSSVTMSAGATVGIQFGLHWGPIEVSVGNSTDPEKYFERAFYGRGVHALQLTLNGGDTEVFVHFYSRYEYTVYVDYCRFDTGNANNELELPTPWAESDLINIRSRESQSGDVIYIACDGFQQRRIERRDNNSWSLVYYEPENGPFRIQNTTETTIAPSAINGDITLTASDNVFKETQVGSLIKMASQGQVVTRTFTAVDALTEDWTDPIRVTGIGDGRKFGIILSGTWVGGDKIHLQYSVGSSAGPWIDSSVKGPWTTNVDTTHKDDQDNQILYWRIGVKTAETITNTVTATLNYTAGSITGICRITDYTDAQNVSAIVLKNLGSTDATADWWEAEWSDRRGYPSATALFESRLFHAGKDKIRGSASDQYEFFDEDETGDSEQIGRTIGFGPRQSVNWLLPLSQLMMGTAENSAKVEPVSIIANNPIAGRSTSFGEPVTPTNFNLRRVNARGIFLDRTEQRLHLITPGSNDSTLEEFTVEDLSLTAPDFNEIGIVHIEIQHKPDIRVHCVRSDGTVGVMVFDRAENVICWIDVETDGVVEDVTVLPGRVEDQVYYTVKRTINGATKRYHEKWAMESEAMGGSMNKIADAFVLYSSGATQTISGLSHLEGKKVVVWGDGKDLTEYDASGNHTGPTVSGGQIGISEPAAEVCVGLRYEAEYVSNKLAQADNDPGFNERRNVKLLGLMLRKTHRFGLKYGPDLNRLYDMPGVENEQVLDDNKLWDHYEKDMIPFGGTWDADSRVCLKSEAPKPVTVLAVKASQNVSMK
jgi:hypothetical protein